MSMRHRGRNLLSTDTSSEWSDAASSAASNRRVLSKGKKPFKRSRGVRATVEAAAERSRSHFVKSVCDELCPQFKRLEVKASRISAIEDALLHLPAHKALQKKCRSLEREMAKASRRLRLFVGEDDNERRVASDGRAYTRAEFSAYYGKLHWDAAAAGTDCFGEADQPMALHVREKRAVPMGRWCSLAAAQLPVADPYAPANERVAARAPDLFDCRGPSESGSESDGSVGSLRSSRTRSRGDSLPSISAADSASEASFASDGSGASASAVSTVGPSALDHSDSEGVSDPEDADEVSLADGISVASEASMANGESSAGETSDDDDGEEEEEEVEEITLNGKCYYASGITVDPSSVTGFTRDSNGPIYGIQADDDVGEQVGEVVSGKPRLFKAKRSVASAR